MQTTLINYGHGLDYCVICVMSVYLLADERVILFWARAIPEIIL